MKIIIGLGNPGKEYAATRHNIGFAILDKLQSQQKFPPFEFSKKFVADISKKGDTILAKPQTFMNLSGKSVRAMLDFYKLLPNDILIIQDDLDIAAGKFKLATNSSSAGHNGIQSIIDELGTQEFKRIRVGIGEESADGSIKCRLGAHDFVLGKLSEEENEKLESVEKNVLDEIAKFI